MDMAPHLPSSSALLAATLAAGLLLPSTSASGAGHAPSDTLNAREVLAEGLAKAAATKRMVFLHSGAPWCGWCKRLERWLERDDIDPIFSKDFVPVRIDVEEMEEGKAVMDQYTGGYGGVPFLVILGPDGRVLVDSFAPNGRNIGSPQAEWGIEHWNTMMRETATRITEEEIQYMARTWAEDRRGQEAGELGLQGPG